VDNFYDRYGYELNIGDRVKFKSHGEPEGTGTITSFKPYSYRESKPTVIRIKRDRQYINHTHQSIQVDRDSMRAYTKEDGWGYESVTQVNWVELIDRPVEKRVEHSVFCEECDLWSTIDEDEARHKMAEFEVINLKDDGTAQYKCCECGCSCDSFMEVVEVES